MTWPRNPVVFGHRAPSPCRAVLPRLCSQKYRLGCAETHAPQPSAASQDCFMRQFIRGHSERHRDRRLCLPRLPSPFSRGAAKSPGCQPLRPSPARVVPFLLGVWGVEMQGDAGPVDPGTRLGGQGCAAPRADPGRFLSPPLHPASSREHVRSPYPSGISMTQAHAAPV